jgi:hypothetical protein
MKEETVYMVTEMKFGINKYSEVFYRVGPVYRRLTKTVIVNQYAVFLQKDVTLVLLTLSFIQLAMHQPCIELMSD